MALRGLTVNSQGQLLRDGVRFRNIGLNYGGAIVPIRSQPSTTACAYTSSADQDAMLDIAVAMKVKVLRIKATPYWPAQWRYGVNGGVAGVASTPSDREAHYLKIDAFIAKCRSRGIGVILNHFFRMSSVSDLAGETIRAGWLTPGSPTRVYAQKIAEELVQRYLTEEAVYGHEFSNELNHYNNANDATITPTTGSQAGVAGARFPGVNTSYGTLASYAAADNMFRDTDLRDVLTWWYGVCRAFDSQRIFMTGNGPNSYSQPGGAAGISSPMVYWHLEQVRDNPTNCGSIHWYGNVGYGSPNFRGLSSIFTGCRHWQRGNGRAFIPGEFGNQPWGLLSLNASGGTLTAIASAKCPMEVGDTFKIAGTNSTFNSTTSLTVKTITQVVVGSDTRTEITADFAGTGSWSGEVSGLQHMTSKKLTQMLADIIAADVDVALFWCVDSDPLTPIWESVTYPGNEEQRAAILAANTALGH